MISIQFDDREVREALNRAMARAGNLKPLMEDIGESVLLSVKRNFEAEGRPALWKKSKRAEAGGGQTLSDKARLRNSITLRAMASQVEVGTNVEYAAIHHFGGKAGRGRKVTLPARPYLMLQDGDVAAIIRATEHHILGGI